MAASLAFNFAFFLSFVFGLVIKTRSTHGVRPRQSAIFDAVAVRSLALKMTAWGVMPMNANAKTLANATQRNDRSPSSFPSWRLEMRPGDCRYVLLPWSSGRNSLRRKAGRVCVYRHLRPSWGGFVINCRQQSLRLCACCLVRCLVPSLKSHEATTSSLSILS